MFHARVLRCPTFAAVAPNTYRRARLSSYETTEVADIPASDPNFNLGYHVIQSTVQAACNSDKSTVAEYANLSNRLPNLRLVAISRANVERS